MSRPSPPKRNAGRRLRDAATARSAPGDLVLRLDETGTVVEVLGGGASLPWSADLLPGRTLAAALPPPVRREVLAAQEAVRAGDGPVAVQFALAEGPAARHAEIRLAPHGAAGAIAVLRDISDERRTLIDLTSQTTFLRQVLDLDPNLIFAKDREGRFTLANRAVASIYGVSPSELVGKTDADFNPDASEVERFRQDDLEVMDTLKPKHIAEEPVSSPDGGTRWFQTIKIPIVSPDGRADGVLGVASDITARKIAEDRLGTRGEQLRRQQAALRDLALMSATDLRTSLERILRSATRTLGVERAGVWLFAADRSVLRTECVLDRGEIVDEPARLFRAHEHPAYFHALHEMRVIAAEDAASDPLTGTFGADYCAPLGIASMLDAPVRSHGEMIGVVCHEHRGRTRAWTLEEREFAASIADIVSLALEASKRSALEEQLRNAQKMEAVGLLAGGIAHDFNNLLNIILGHGELAAKALPADHAGLAHVQAMTDACARASDLVRKILTFSRGQILTVQPVDFGRLLRDFASLLDRILGDDVELTVTASESPMIVRADRTQLEQILLNLCTNARQAMPRGGRLELSAHPTHASGLGTGEGSVGAHVHLCVRDTGHGIDDATMARLWEPFFTTKADGTGLGLSMVYGIVRQHGGAIHAESRVGRGTAFHVYLPIERPESVESTSRPHVGPRRGRETLLVAEDESLIRDLLIESLGELGYDVLAAENGAAALEIFEARRDEIDMVILDVMMPKISGPDALRSMRERRPDLKALFISGHAPESSRLPELLDVTGRAFLSKPFLLDALAEKVREVLDGER